MSLNLPGWVVSCMEEMAQQFVVCATYTPAPPACAHCRTAGKLRKYGFWEQEIADVPRNGKPVRIVLTRQKYHCRACGRTFLQPLTGMAEGRNMTCRLVDYIEREAGQPPRIAKVARETGLSESAVRSVVRAARPAAP